MRKKDRQTKRTENKKKIAERGKKKKRDGQLKLNVSSMGNRWVRG